MDPFTRASCRRSGAGEPGLGGFARPRASGRLGWEADVPAAPRGTVEKLLSRKERSGSRAVSLNPSTKAGRGGGEGGEREEGTRVLEGGV